MGLILSAGITFSSQSSGGTGTPPVGVAGLTGSVYGDFSGPVTAAMGTERYYFSSSATIIRQVMHTFVNVVGDVVMTIKKNGVALAPTTLLDGTNTVNNFTGFSVVSGDYITIDITSGTCSDLSVRLDY